MPQHRPDQSNLRGQLEAIIKELRERSAPLNDPTAPKEDAFN